MCDDSCHQSVLLFPAHASLTAGNCVYEMLNSDILPTRDAVLHAMLNIDAKPTTIWKSEYELKINSDLTYRTDYIFSL